jgi:hypothetical protein
LECGGRDAALAFARESQSGVAATALHNYRVRATYQKNVRYSLISQAVISC